MSFLAPAAFWFAALIPVLVLFYLLKRKRVVKLVSSTLLWQRFLAESQASAPFQKLRKNWLLLLQLLVLCLVIFALTRPFFPAHVRPAQRRVLILDASASMRATDVKPSRFDNARDEALKWIDNMRSAEEMVVVQAGAETQVRQSATQNKNALRRALMACAASDGPTRLGPALQMAESLVRDQPGAEIHLFSDGAAEALGEFEDRGLPLFYHKIGSGSNNVAITAIDSRPNPGRDMEHAVYVNLENFSGQEKPVTLELSLDDRVLETRAAAVPAGASAAEVFIARQTQDGIFSVRLVEPDDLAADNRASIPSVLPRPARVLLVSAGNRLLERALRACPNVELSVSAMLNEPAAGFDLVVLDSVMPSVWPSANVLAFKAYSTNWFPNATRVESPPIVDWRGTHPLLRYAGFEDVGISESLAVKTPSWAVSLLDSPQAALMIAGELGRQRIVWAGFDPLDSNWPLRVSFPIFIANAVEWLAPASTSSSRLMVKSGDTFRFPLVEPVQTVSVSTPSGRQLKFPLEQNAPEFVLGATQEQGAYKAAIGTNQVVFCVNLLNPKESNIRPRDELSLGSRNRVASAAPQRASLEIWRALAALGLLLLMCEWWYYHKRTA